MAIWIQSQEQLHRELQKITGRYALDTEFLRERTFWPKLALVQIAIPTDDPESPEVLLIDPLQSGIHRELRALFDNPERLAIVHSPSEDWVALRENVGSIPKVAYDTQHAAAMLGMGGGMSYLRLIETTLGITLEKGEQRSDWLQRPLTDSQQKYAAYDVLYLLQAYDVVDAQIRARNFADWFAQDMAYSLDQARVDSIDAWPHLGLRGAGQLSVPQQQVLHRLLLWREERSRSSDLPRSWVLSNELALAIARARPRTQEEMQRVLASVARAPYKIAQLLLSVANKPLPNETELPDAQLLELRDKQTVRDLQDAVKKVADGHGFSDGFLASRRWIESWIDSGEWQGPLAGWRRELLAAPFSAIRPVSVQVPDPEDTTT